MRRRAARAAQRLDVQAQCAQRIDHECARSQLVAEQRMVVRRPGPAHNSEALRLDLGRAILGNIRRNAGMADLLGANYYRDGILVLDLGSQSSAVALEVFGRSGWRLRKAVLEVFSHRLDPTSPTRNLFPTFLTINCQSIPTTII